MRTDLRETQALRDGVVGYGDGLFSGLYDEAVTLLYDSLAYLEAHRSDGAPKPAGAPPNGDQGWVLEELTRLATGVYPVKLAHAGESMRLTTRIMQVMAWLLVQRAVHNGEMTPGEARKDRYRVEAQGVCLGTPLPGAEQLPDTLRELLERSERLYRRVLRLDGLIMRGRERRFDA